MHMISLSSGPLSQAALRVVSIALFLCASTIAVAQDATATDTGAAPAENSAPPADAAAAPAPAADTSAAPATAETPPATYDNSVPVQEQTAQAAEQPAAENGEGVKLEKVEVTGSRIKRTDYETAQPVTVLKREDIDRSGLTNIGDLLAKMTAAGTSINTSASTIFLAGGETNLDLRNLGTNRVLVLVNGRRWVNGLVSTSTSSVDLNTIPTAIIERVEVLKDGASAIYGSDAIAGVVNIITRKNYSGVDLSSQWGRYEEGDGAKQQHQLSFGSASTWTSWFVNGTYTQDDVVKTTSRQISEAPGSPELGKTRWNGIGPEGRLLFIPEPQVYALLGPSKCPLLDLGIAAGAGVPLCDLSHTVGTPGTNFVTDFHKWDPNTDSYNRYTDSYLQNPDKRAALYAQLNQRITDSISFSFEGLFNQTKAHSRLRPQALLVGDLAGSDIFVSRTQMYNPFTMDIGAGDPKGIVPGGFCNPTLVGIAPSVITVPTVGGVGTDAGCSQVGPDGIIGEGAAMLRLVKFPPVLLDYNVNTLRLGGGFNGGFNLGPQFFTWDLGYAYATNKKKEIRRGDYYNDRMKLSLGPASGCTGDCVPLNIFNGQDGVTDAMINYLALTATNYTRTRQDDAYANISTDLGPIHVPGASPIQVAIGGEYRKEAYDDNPDQALQQGLSSGNNAVATRGQTVAKEVYAELSIPVFQDLPVIKQFDLSAAARLSNYKNFGTARTGKLGARWKPYDDLLFRGTYSGAFRAPSVGELFLGDSDSFDVVADPCDGPDAGNATTNCGSDNVAPHTTPQQVRVTKGGNPALQPETARTATIGMVFSPSFVRDFNFTLDWYRIKLKGFISPAGSQFILDSCYANAPDQRSLCEFVQRGPDGQITAIQDRNINFLSVLTSGVDGMIDYRLPIPAQFGRTKIVLDAAYLINWDQTVPTATGGSSTVGAVGQTVFFSYYPRWKATGELQYKLGGLSASWSTRMVYKTDESCVDSVPNILAPGPTLREAGVCSAPRLDADGNDISRNVLPTHFYHDLQLGYEVAPWKLAVTVGVKNITHTEPPVSHDPTTGGAYFNYNILSDEIPGSFTYFKVEKKF
jgi:iron complex outermembrane receptor protein